MSAEQIDAYLATLDNAQRANLNDLRSLILELLPDAEQGMSYAMPAFSIDGSVVAGFAAFKHHLSYFPHSGSVLASLDEGELTGFDVSKGTLRFDTETRLPKRLVARLIELKRAEVDSCG